MYDLRVRGRPTDRVVLARRVGTLVDDVEGSWGLIKNVAKVKMKLIVSMTMFMLQQ